MILQGLPMSVIVFFRRSCRYRFFKGQNGPVGLRQITPVRNAGQVDIVTECSIGASRSMHGEERQQRTGKHGKEPGRHEAVFRSALEDDGSADMQ